MEELINVVDWSRAQFALTAIYHWLFVPLTLGLGIIVAVMETIYFKTKSEKWLATTKFWMTIFGVNFAIGVATGIILEFEFGTNWSNYSWFVGDIFGAPLAVEGILAFFMESTFIAVMFFGWKKVSPKFHAVSHGLRVQPRHHAQRDDELCCCSPVADGDEQVFPHRAERLGAGRCVCVRRVRLDDAQEAQY